MKIDLVAIFTDRLVDPVYGCGPTSIRICCNRLEVLDSLGYEPLLHSCDVGEPGQVFRHRNACWAVKSFRDGKNLVVHAVEVIQSTNFFNSIAAGVFEICCSGDDTCRVSPEQRAQISGRGTGDLLIERR